MCTARKILPALAFAIGFMPAALSAMAQGAVPETTFCSGYSADSVSGYWGDSGKAHLSAAIYLGGEMLNGNRIVALKCAVEAFGKVTDCKLFVKKDLAKDENLYEQEFQPVGGWNYVMFDFPFYLNGMAGLYVGYELTATGSCVGYGRISQAVDGAGYVRVNSGPWTVLSVPGSAAALSVGAVLCGGDYSAMTHNAAGLQGPLMPRVVKAGDGFRFGGTLVNRGVETLERFDVCWRVNGGAEMRSTVETTLLNGQVRPFEMLLEVPEGENTVDVYFDRVNGMAGTGGYKGSFTVEAFEKAFAHKALVEYYTSQGCANCPPAKEVFDRAAAGCKDRLAMVAHHAGYVEDLFSIQYSWDLAAVMGVSSAPSMTIDRTVAKVGGGSSVVFHPGNITASAIRDFTIDASLAGVSIGNVFYQADSMLVVDVSVDKDRSLENPLRLHVYLSENGYVAYQGSPTGGMAQYVHDHFPRASLTPVGGDELVFDAGGKSSRSYTYKVPAGYEALVGGGTLPSCPEKMEIVAFAAAAEDGGKPGRVYNTAVEPLLFAGGTSVKPCAGYAVMPFAVSAGSGTVCVSGQFAEASVFTLQGALAARLLPCCRQTGLMPGIYIVKVKHLQGASSVKVTVR